jgi:enoyl-CoA hydratase
MTDEDLLYDFDKGIGILTLNRQRLMNVLNLEIVLALTRLLDSIAASDIRCLVITAAEGKAFVAGADIKEMMGMGRRQAENFSLAGNRLMRKIETFPMPVIAAINGFALGGGLELALTCDMRLASDKATFGLPEVSFGIIPGYGGIQRLTRLIGRGRASELLFSSRIIGAREALDWGLVNQVHQPDRLMPETLGIAGTIATKPPIAVAAAKKTLNDSIGLELDRADQLEVQAFGTCFGTWDQREAMRAFVEKKSPSPFKG